LVRKYLANIAIDSRCEEPAIASQSGHGFVRLIPFPMGVFEKLNVTSMVTS
jgi:hypothetical protein